MSLDRVLVIHNTSSGGGGIYNNAGTLTIENSTISDNIAVYDGGGILSRGISRISNSTLSGNRASLGGALANNLMYGDGPIYLNNVTLVNNTATQAGGGICAGGTVSLQNTLLAGNGGQAITPECAGTLKSQGYNLIQNTAGCSLSGDLTGNLTGVAPQLLPAIGDLGYFPLSANSPAVDAGSPAGCLDSLAAPLPADTRGAPRQGRCDIGAYEYTLPGPAASLTVYTGTVQRAYISQPFPAPLQVLALDQLGSPVSGTVVSLSAPDRGASGLFPESGAISLTTTTAESGITAPAAFTANAIAGRYTVWATTSDVLTPTAFALANWAQFFLPVVVKPDPAAIVAEYPFTNRCVTLPVRQYGQVEAQVTMCVTSVQIRQDRQMKFNMRWSVQFLSTTFDWVHKGSDVGNRNMNVTDNLNQRYDHVALGGAAAQDVYFYRVGGPWTAEGWYLFPPAQSGATVFTFHDDDQHVLIDQIVLGQ